MSDERRGRKSTYLNSKGTPFEPGDEVVGEWPRDRVVPMDARFVDAVERAIARGKEHPRDEPQT